MKVTSVNEGDINRSATQTPGNAEPAKTAANDQHPMMTHSFRSRSV
jgi:hypothetical protein